MAYDTSPRPIARSAGRLIHPKLLPFPVACFTGALLTDIAYARSADMMWANFSAWLLAIGGITGALALLAGLVDLLRSRRTGAPRPTWLQLLAGIAVLVLALFDNFVHSRDAWTSVVPTGLILSAATVAMMLVTALLGAAPADRRRVGVAA